jgi:hypothetical protein
MTRPEKTTFSQAQMLHMQNKLEHCRAVLTDEFTWLGDMIDATDNPVRKSVYITRRDKIAFAIGYIKS